MAKKKTAHTFEGIDATLQELASVVKTIATMTAKKKALEANLIERAGIKYWAQKAGSLFVKSIEFLGGTRKVTVTHSDSFGTANPDQEDALREAFENRFDELFQIQTGLKLKDIDADTVRALIGPEMFDRLFEVTTKIACVKGMDQLQLSLTGAQRAALDEQGVVQKSPTVKLADLKPGETEKYVIVD